MAKKYLEDRVHEKYDDPDVAQHVLQSIKDHGTHDKIMSGELVLPGVDDATRNHQIATGTFFTTEKEREQQEYISKMEARLRKLEDAQQPQPTVGNLSIQPAPPSALTGAPPK